VEKTDDIFRKMDIAAKRCKNQFSAYFTAGYEYEEDFFAEKDRRLYDELERFAMFLPRSFDERQNVDNINGLFINNKIYGMLKGNTSEIGKTITEKIKEKIEEQKCPHMLIIT
jgi:hypothetical protein